MYTPTHGPGGQCYYLPAGTDPSAAQSTNPGTQIGYAPCQPSEWASEASRDRAEILLGAVPLGFAITLDDRAEQH